MKTVQDWLRASDAEAIIAEYLFRYPIDFPMLQNKGLTVKQVFETVKENLRRLIQKLLAMEAIASEDHIFYASSVSEGQSTEIHAELSHRGEILSEDMPKSYGWDFTPWDQTLGYLIAETKLTLDHMTGILADILNGMTVFGFDQEAWEKRVSEMEDSLRSAEEELLTGNCRPAKEVFAEFDLPEIERDEEAFALSRKVFTAKWEYDFHCRTREAQLVRQLLLREEF